MKKLKLKKTENQVKAEIKNILDILGIYNWPVTQGLGSHKGLPDREGVIPAHINPKWAGKMLAIEAKTEKGRLSDYQRTHLSKVKSAGGIAFVARSADDVIRELGVEDRFIG